MKTCLILIQKLPLEYKNLKFKVLDTLANYVNRDNGSSEEDDALEALEELCTEAEFQSKSLNILEAIRRFSEEVIGYVEEHHRTKAQDPAITSIR